MKDKYKKKKKPVSYKVRRSKHFALAGGGAWCVVRDGKEIAFFTNEIEAQYHKQKLVKEESK